MARTHTTVVAYVRMAKLVASIGALVWRVWPPLGDWLIFSVALPMLRVRVGKRTYRLVRRA